jgi:class 3 adenylate cyclase
LCDIAKSGQTIIGGTTWRQIKDCAESLAIGAVVLEGKANPVDAYELLGMKT